MWYATSTYTRPLLPSVSSLLAETVHLYLHSCGTHNAVYCSVLQTNTFLFILQLLVGRVTADAGV